MAEKTKDNHYTPDWVTAADAVAPYDKDDKSIAAERAELRDKHDVVSASFAEYAEALDAYQERDDVETLANRRARENGTGFTDNDHIRAKKGKGGKGVETKDNPQFPNQVEGK